MIGETIKVGWAGQRNRRSKYTSFVSRPEYASLSFFFFSKSVFPLPLLLLIPFLVLLLSFTEVTRKVFAGAKEWFPALHVAHHRSVFPLSDTRDVLMNSSAK